jgi:hypothetical protein
LLLGSSAIFLRYGGTSACKGCCQTYKRKNSENSVLSHGRPSSSARKYLPRASRFTQQTKSMRLALVRAEQQNVSAPPDAAVQKSASLSPQVRHADF